MAMQQRISYDCGSHFNHNYAVICTISLTNTNQIESKDLSYLLCLMAANMYKHG